MPHASAQDLVCIKECDYLPFTAHMREGALLGCPVLVSPAVDGVTPAITEMQNVQSVETSPRISTRCIPAELQLAEKPLHYANRGCLDQNVNSQTDLPHCCRNRSGLQKQMIPAELISFSKAGKSARARGYVSASLLRALSLASEVHSQSAQSLAIPRLAITALPTTLQAVTSVAFGAILKDGGGLDERRASFLRDSKLLCKVATKLLSGTTITKMTELSVTWFHTPLALVVQDMKPNIRVGIIDPQQEDVEFQFNVLNENAQTKLYLASTPQTGKHRRLPIDTASQERGEGSMDDANHKHKDESFIVDCVLEHVQYHVRGMDTQVRKITQVWLNASPLYLRMAPNPSAWQPRGILLHGASGTGKTLMVNVLINTLRNSKTWKRVFPSSIGAPLPRQKVINMAELFQSDFGAGERYLCECFDTVGNCNRNDDLVGQQTVCGILVLDEIDIIASKPRKGQKGGTNHLVQRLKALLFMLMDDAAKRRLPVVIIGITSQPEVLDRAIFRPGRLELVIECPIPDAKARLNILRHIVSKRLKGKPDGDQHAIDNDDADDDQLVQVAKSTHGMVAADLVSLCREATMAHLHDLVARNKVNVSPMANLQMKDWMAALAIVRPSGLRTMQHDTRVPEGTPCISELTGMGSLSNQAEAAVLAPLRQAEQYYALGVSPPSGLLLHGASGNGKTLLALVLAQEAKICGLANFISVRCTELVSKVVGESERAVAEVFHRARKMSPCIVLLDQIEAIARRRKSAEEMAATSEHTWDRLLSCLLTELDGVGSKPTTSAEGRGDENMAEQVIVVIGVTQDMSLLDPALVRPGRFDTHLRITPPSKEQVVELFSLGLKKSLQHPSFGKEGHLSNNIIHEAARYLMNCQRVGTTKKTISRADVLGICRESIMSAIRENYMSCESAKGNSRKGEGIDVPEVMPEHLWGAISQQFK